MKTPVTSFVGRLCLSLFICSAVTAVCHAQESNTLSPPLEVLKLKWEKQVRLPRNFDPSITPTGGTFNDPAAKTIPTNPADAVRAATSAQSAAQASNSAFPATPARLPVYYVYSLKMRNDADREIGAVAWDYLFLDPNTGAELARHQFLSYVKTEPSRTVTLQAQNRTPPIRILRAANNGKHTRPIERVEIQCVLFADDTVWRNRFGRKGTCELLKNSETALKQKRSNAQR
jgi:hypothetical protein